jgi:hypothetical protein
MRVGKRSAAASKLHRLVRLRRREARIAAGAAVRNDSVTKGMIGSMTKGMIRSMTRGEIVDG